MGPGSTLGDDTGETGEISAAVTDEFRSFGEGLVFWSESYQNDLKFWPIFFPRVASNWGFTVFGCNTHFVNGPWMGQGNEGLFDDVCASHAVDSSIVNQTMRHEPLLVVAVMACGDCCVAGTEVWWWLWWLWHAKSAAHQQQQHKMMLAMVVAMVVVVVVICKEYCDCKHSVEWALFPFLSTACFKARSGRQSAQSHTATT